MALDPITLVIAKKYTDEQIKQNSTGGVDLSGYYTREEIDAMNFVTSDELPEGGMVDKTLTIEGQAADAKATGDRLLGVEYQTIVTEEAYEHKNLPEGEKTVAINGDGVFGNNAYIVCGEDIIPRKTFNRKFPFNGITVTRNEKTYHIEGAATEAGTVVFGKTINDININFEEDISGKSFKLITFANQTTDGNMSVVVKFFDSNNNVVQVLHSSGSLKNQIADYIAKTTLSRVVDFSIPENTNIAYMQIYISFKADCVFNHDFQIYVVESENTIPIMLEQPTTTITNINMEELFSFPYRSVTTIKSPITDYINYMAQNAKGDTATYLTPEAFGAVGDGYTDDINAITLCLAKAAQSKQTVLMAKKYLITTPIDINGAGFNIYINDVVYTGSDTAVKIHGQQNTVKIHSINSSGAGIKFLGDGEKNSSHNDLEINTIISASHGIVFECLTTGLYQHNVRFDYIQAGGDGCYGIAYFNTGEIGTFGENNFYGGHIANCEWACYKIRGNSRFYGIEVEGNVRGGFYIDSDVSIFHPRIAESQRDGDLPIYKFIDTKNTTIYDSSGIAINQIDLSEANDTFFNASEQEYPLYEQAISKINGRIYARTPNTGENTIGNVYCREAYVWGKYLIMKPHMAYRKEVGTETLDTRLIGQEGADEDLKIFELSQLPTEFVVDTVNTEIYLHESYCAFGFNEFEVEQANGFTCKVYDKLNNLIFDGTNQGDGIYKFKVSKDATHCANRSSGLLRVDFLGHYWKVTKETTVNDVLNALNYAEGGTY